MPFFVIKVNFVCLNPTTSKKNDWKHAAIYQPEVKFTVQEDKVDYFPYNYTLRSVLFPASVCFPFIVRFNVMGRE